MFRPAVFALLSALEKDLIKELIADFALLPNASSPSFTIFNELFILEIELLADFAFFAMDFMDELTAFSATDIAATPTAAAVIPRPKAAIPTVPAAAATPSATTDVLSKSITALSAVAAASIAVNEVHWS